MVDILLFAAAAFNIAFGVFHLMFGRLFDWKHDLPRLRAINQSIVPVLNLALTFMFLLVGAVMLLESPNPTLLVGMAVFWLFRGLLQPIYFGFRHPVSMLFTVLFVLGALIHATTWIILP